MRGSLVLDVFGICARKLYPKGFLPFQCKFQYWFLVIFCNFFKERFGTKRVPTFDNLLEKLIVWVITVGLGNAIDTCK